MMKLRNKQAAANVEMSKLLENFKNAGGKVIQCPPSGPKKANATFPLRGPLWKDGHTGTKLKAQGFKK